MADSAERLRALADMHYPAKLTVVLREAADALERAHTLWDHETKRADDLKAKLAEAESRSSSFHKAAMEAEAREEKAEAEAAALRKVLRDFSTNWDCDTGANECHHDHCRACAAKRALSQPGPGAALLERVKKLEAVAERANEMLDDEGMRAVTSGPLAEALAALEEKP